MIYSDSNLRWQDLGGIAGLIFYLGFLSLCLGYIRPKGFINFLFGCFSNAILSAIIWFTFGWMLSFGDSSTYLVGSITSENDLIESTIFFVWALLGISINIYFGTLADRIKIKVLIWLCFSHSFFIFPMCIHSNWATGWASPFRSNHKDLLLIGCGALDIGGSGVIYLSGGTVALIAVNVLEPRFARFQAPGIKLPKSSRYYQYVGVLLMFLTWLAVNFALAASSSGSLSVGRHALIATFLSSITAWFTALFLGWITEGKLYFELANNGLLSGAVAISSVCGVIEFYCTPVIGITAVISYYFSSKILIQMNLDDITDSVPIFFVNGILGMLVPGIFTSKTKYSKIFPELYEDGTSRIDHCSGILYGSYGSQLLANFCSIFATISFSAIITYGVLHILKHSLVGEFAFSEEQQKIGLDNNVLTYNNTDWQSSKKSNKEALAVNKEEVKKKRKESAFQFTNGYSWDFVIVFEDTEKGKKYAEQLHIQLVDQVIEVYTFHSEKFIFCKIRAPIQIFQHLADEINFKMLLDEQLLFKAANRGIRYTQSEIQEYHRYAKAHEGREGDGGAGSPSNIVMSPTTHSSSNIPMMGDFKVAPIIIEHEPRVTKIFPYRYIYAGYEYDNVRVRNLFATQESLKHPFGNVARIKLLEHILETISFTKFDSERKRFRPRLQSDFLIEKEVIPQNKESYHRTEKEESVITNMNNNNNSHSNIIKQHFSNGKVNPEMTETEKKKKNSSFICGLETLVLQGIIVAYFPIHNKTARRTLWLKWKAWDLLPSHLPIDSVKEYLGEKIGLYFQFLIHYTSWLSALSVFGIIASLYILTKYIQSGSAAKAVEQRVISPIFCFIVSLWAELMFEYWKRKEVAKAMEWGTTDFEEKESVRPQFYGQVMNSYIDGKEIVFFSKKARRSNVSVSVTIVAGAMTAVIAAVSTIYYAKYYSVFKSQNEMLNNYGSTVASVINSVQILIFNHLYTKLAIYLNHFENYRTDTEFEDALIIKMFCFQFVNGYASLFYVAFIKELIGDPCVSSCTVELSQNVLIIFSSRMILVIVKGIIIPNVIKYLKNKQLQEKKKNKSTKQRRNGFCSGWWTWCCSGRVSYEEEEDDDDDSDFEYSIEHIKGVEHEFTLSTYDTVLGPLADYAELVLETGYVTLFASALPVLPVLALISNLIQIRVDLWKLLYLFRRPMPCGAADIGSWFGILQGLAAIAVFVNMGILFFTMTIFDEMETRARMALLIGLVATIFMIKAIFGVIVKDVPDKVTIQLARQSYLVEKIVEGEPDERHHTVDDYEELLRINKKNKKKFQVLDEDDEIKN